MKIKPMNGYVFVIQSSVRPCPNDCGYLLGKVIASQNGIKVGDTIIFGSACKSSMDLGGESYYIIHPTNIIGVIEEEK